MALNEKTRKLIRDFYQAIPTPEDKARFKNIQCMSYKDRVAFIGRLSGGTKLPEGLYDVLINVGSFTKEDRIMIFSGVIRQFIFNLLTRWGF